MKCPHCSGNIDIHFIKAPPDIQGNSNAPIAERSDDLESLLDAIDDSKLTGNAVDFVAQTRDTLMIDDFIAKFHAIEKISVEARNIESVLRIEFGELHFA